MYRFSRAIYLELAPAIQCGPGDPDGARARKRLLEAAEETVERMASDRDFARPWKSLFIRVRFDFSLIDQRMVADTIERHLRLAREVIERRRHEMTFQPQRCRGTSRDGDPCRRKPVEGREFCPSHYHLEEHWDGDHERASIASEGALEVRELAGVGSG